MATEGNPAYGLSSPHRRPDEDKEDDYEIPHYTQPPSEVSEEGVYEGVY